MLPIKFQVNCLLVQEKKRKIDFQIGLCVSDQNYLAIFDLQVTLMLPTKFQVNWPLGSGEEVKNRFSRCCHGCHLGFPTGMILAILNLQVINASYQVSSQLAQGCRRSRLLKQLLMP